MRQTPSVPSSIPGPLLVVIGGLVGLFGCAGGNPSGAADNAVEAMGTTSATSSALATPGLNPSGGLNVDADSHFWNGSNAVTWGSFQYMAFWDAADATTGKSYAKLMRRHVATNAVQTIRFDGTHGQDVQANPRLNDGHNSLLIGLAATDGTIHISWTEHSGPHHYGISVPHCLSTVPQNFNNCFGGTWRTSQADPTHEATSTYPNYFNSTNGDLFMLYRYGYSANSDWYLNRYDGAGSWTSMGMVIHGHSKDNATGRGPYMFGIAFDKFDRLHAMWLWRERLNMPLGDFGTFYAYSDDYGATWKRRDTGAVFATNTSDPIVVEDDAFTLASDVPAGYVPNTTQFEFDSNNRPHLVMSTYDTSVTDLLLGEKRLRHIWLGTNGTWYSQWIEPAGTGSQMGTYGHLFLDNADKAHYVYSRSFVDWSAYNADAYDQNELPDDRVTVQSSGPGQGYLDVQQASSTTAIRTVNYINTPIGVTGSRQVRIGLSNNTDATTATICFTTAASTDWTTDKCKTLAITANDGAIFKAYTVDMTSLAAWTGTLRELDIDMNDSTAEAGDQFKLDYVRVTNGIGVIAKAWEFNSLAAELRVAEAPMDNNWSTWSLSTLDIGARRLTRLDGDYAIDKQRYRNTGIVSFPVTYQGAPGTESYELTEYTVANDTLAKQWLFDLDVMDWGVSRQVSGFGWGSAEGSLNGTLAGNNSAIRSTYKLGIKVYDTTKVIMRLKNASAATHAKVSFITDEDETWDDAKSKRITIQPNSDYTTYTFDMSAAVGWGNGHTLRQMTIDPADDDGVSTGSFKIDSLYLPN